MKESGKERLKSTIYESTRAPLTRSPFPDGEGKLVAATPQTFMGRCPKVCDGGFPVLDFPNIAHLTANNKDFSTSLEMTVRESH